MPLPHQFLRHNEKHVRNVLLAVPETKVCNASWEMLEGKTLFVFVHMVCCNLLAALKKKKNLDIFLNLCNVMLSHCSAHRVWNLVNTFLGF